MLNISIYLLLGMVLTLAICCFGLELEVMAGQIQKILGQGSPCQLTFMSSTNKHLLQHLHESQFPLVTSSNDHHLLQSLLPEVPHAPRTKEYCWNLVLASDTPFREKQEVSGILLTIGNHLLGRHASNIIIAQNELFPETDILPSVWYGEHLVINQAGHTQR